MGAGDPWLLVQHVAFEGPGAIALAVDRRGRATSRSCGWTVVTPSHPPEAVGDVAGLVVMGGPMSVHDDVALAGRRARPPPRAVEAGRPVLGVCLGAQQLAAALGAPR